MSQLQLTFFAFLSNLIVISISFLISKTMSFCIFLSWFHQIFLLVNKHSSFLSIFSNSSSFKLSIINARTISLTLNLWSSSKSRQIISILTNLEAASSSHIIRNWVLNFRIWHKKVFTALFWTWSRFDKSNVFTLNTRKIRACCRAIRRKCSHKCRATLWEVSINQSWIDWNHVSQSQRDSERNNRVLLARTMYSSSS
jgi:hypothetical protein